VLRGGSWFNTAGSCRMAIRFSGAPAYGWDINGFRLLFAFQFT
jgi:formylglycine-generating enzyme required for sulfatase activity